jgi:hypothetical protein
MQVHSPTTSLSLFTNDGVFFAPRRIIRIIIRLTTHRSRSNGAFPCAHARVACGLLPAARGADDAGLDPWKPRASHGGHLVIVWRCWEADHFRDACDALGRTDDRFGSAPSRVLCCCCFHALGCVSSDAVTGCFFVLPAARLGAAAAAGRAPVRLREALQLPRSRASSARAATVVD